MTTFGSPVVSLSADEPEEKTWERRKRMETIMQPNIAMDFTCLCRNTEEEDRTKGGECDDFRGGKANCILELLPQRLDAGR